MTAAIKSIALLLLVLIGSSGLVTVAQADCKIEQKAKLDIEVDGSNILVPIRMNGIEAKLILNTGLQTTVLFEAALPSLNLREHPSVSLEWSGPRGRNAASVADVKEIVFGGATWRNVSLLTVRSNGQKAGVVGEMGRDILGMYDVEFDLKNRHISLLTMTGCTDAESIYWGGDSFSEASLEERRSVLAGYYTTINLNGRAFGAILDTGSPRTVVDAGMAQLSGITLAGLIDDGPPRPASFPATWPPSAYARFNAVSIGEEQIKNAVLRVTKENDYNSRRGTGTRLGPDAAGNRVANLGMDFFQSHRVLISNSRRKMFFTYSGGSVFPAPSATASP